MEDVKNIDSQIALINGKFALSPSVPKVMETIRSELEKAAKTIVAAIRKEGVSASPWLLQNGLNHIQLAKDQLCCAVILPCHTHQ